MKLFETSVETTILRFYLMMAIVIVSLFAKLYLLTFLAIPVFMSTLLGISFKKDSRLSNTKTTSGKMISPIGEFKTAA